MLAIAMLLASACQPADGAIFVDDGSEAGSSGVPTSTDLPPSGTCEPPGPHLFEGNAPEFSHECGESCDTDWCGCDPCVVASGPLVRLSAGPHRLRILGGASGVGDFHLRIDAEPGPPLLELPLTRNGIFDETFDFSVPAGCPLVRFEWAQLTVVCARLYEVVIDPEM